LLEKEERGGKFAGKSRSPLTAQRGKSKKKNPKTLRRQKESMPNLKDWKRETPAKEKRIKVIVHEKKRKGILAYHVRRKEVRSLRATLARKGGSYQRRVEDE